MIGLSAALQFTLQSYELKTCKQNKFDSKAGTMARAIETLMGQYWSIKVSIALAVVPALLSNLFVYTSSDVWYVNFYKRSGNRVAKLFCSTLCGSPAVNRLLLLNMIRTTERHGQNEVLSSPINQNHNKVFPNFSLSKHYDITSFESSFARPSFARPF